MKINQETIDEIHNRLEIEEVVSDFVSLKRKGQNLWACCPFHYEKSPSFSVVPNKGFYKCFGCGKSGDAIQFLIDLEGLSYLEAMQYLAKKYGIEVKEEEQTDDQLKEQNEKESLHIVLNYAKDFFRNNLWQHEEGQSIGLSYFKERGFSEVVINNFDLGYSLEAWDALLKDAETRGYNSELLEKAGLIIKNENKIYDRFRGRVIFPIHNITGKTIAFGARILKSDKKQPKYLNSPETEVYHKSNTLYGLFQGKQAIRLHDNCYIVEGYTDVISMHLAGVENVVSSSGTSFTEDQIKIIGRYTKNVTMLFDGDLAGIKASLRGIDMILESGLNVRAITFPQGEDPDSYSRKLGTVAFQKFLKENAKDFITFKTLLYNEQTAGDPIKKAETIREIIGSIAKVADPVQRAVYVKECSSLLDIRESILISELNKVQISKNKNQTNEAGNKQFETERRVDALANATQELTKEPQLSHEDIVGLQERESIRLLLNYGNIKFEDEYKIYDYLLSELEDIEIQSPVYKEIINEFKLQLEQGNIPDPEHFIRNGNEEVRNEVINLISQKHEISLNWKKKFQINIPHETDVLYKAVLGNILRLNLRIIQKLIAENMAGLKNTENHEEQDKILRIHATLKKSEMDVAQQLGIVVNK